MERPEFRMLIVDDNASDRMVAKSILMKIGNCNIQEAQDGEEAKAKLQTALEMGQLYDFIFLDWNMPRTNGLKLLQYIRATSRLKKTKVLVMTATANLEVVAGAIQNGANDFIVKPLRFNLVKEKLEKNIDDPKSE